MTGGPLVHTDATELWRRIGAAADRVQGLLGSVDPALSLPDSTWTAGDVAGHLVTVLRRYTHPVRPAATPREVDARNAAELAELADLGPEQLLAALATELAAVRATFPPDLVDLAARLPFHGGTTVDLAAGLGNIIGELLVHGHDVAAAAGRPWPITERDALLVLNGVVQILPGYVRGSADPTSVRLALPGAAPWLVAVEGDRRVVTSRRWQAGDRAEVHLRAPASAVLLVVYGRLSGAGAVRRGLRVTGGRRPWRAGRLAALLERP